MKTPKNKAKNTKKNPKKAPKRRRRLPYIHMGDFSREEKLMEILYEGDTGTTVYVYRAKDDWPVKPYLFTCYPFESLLDRIRDEYGSGKYAIIIRRGTTILFSGITGIEASMNWPAPG